MFQEKGRSVEGRNFVALWRPCEGDGGGVGFAVTRRIGGAVARNRARRRLREAHRRALLAPMTDANVVFVARAGVLTCGFDELMRDIEQAVEAVRGRLAGRKPVVPAKK